MSITFVVFESNTASASEKSTVQTFESEGLIQLKSDKDEEVTVPANVTILSAPDFYSLINQKVLETLIL